MSRRNSILLFLVFICTNVWSQRVIDFEYFLNPPYPRTISELMSQQGLQVIVFNDIPEPLEVYFASELIIADPAGNQIGSIRTTFDRFLNGSQGIGSSISLGPNEEQIIDKEFDFNAFGFVYEDLVFEGIARELFPESATNFSQVFDPTLPEGTYTLCLTAFEKNTQTQLSPKVCSESFDVRSADMWISQPFPNEVISCEEIESLIFDWELSTIDDDCFDYKLEVVEVPEDKIDENGNVQLDFVREMFDRPGQNRVLSEMTMGESAYTSNGDFQIPELDEEKTYAVRVAATLNEQRAECDVVLKNQTTDIVIFKVSCEEEEEYITPDITCENCNQAAPQVYDPIQVSAVPNSFRAGYFNVKDIKNASVSSNKISGQGIITTSLFSFNDLKIGVEFSNVELDKENRMLNGEVKTLPLDISRFAEINVNPDSDYTLEDLQKQSPDQYNNLISAKEFTEYVMGQVESVANDEGLRMPLGIDTEINNKKVVLAIDHMRFDADGAKMAFMINMPLPFNFADDEGAFLSVALTNLCFGPDGTLGSTRLNVKDDIPIWSQNVESGNNGDGYELIVKGCGENCGNGEVDEINGTNVKIGCSGIEEITFQCALRFDDDHIRPFQQYYDEQEIELEDRPNKVEAVFGFSTSTTGSEEQDWLVAAKISPFEFRKLKGYGFSVGDETNAAWLDMSVNRNPNKLEFPDGHVGNLDETWKGLYINKARIYLPNYLRDGLDKDFNIGSNHMIFNLGEGQESSFSADIGFYRLFKRDEVSLGRWEFGIDTIDVSIVNKEFERGRLVGELGAPILHQDDYFTYQATMLHDELEDDSELDYSFIVKPKSGDEERPQARIPLFLINADLAKESHITMEYDKSEYQTDDNNGFRFNMSLVGSLKIDVENADYVTDNRYKLSKLPLACFGLPFVLKYDTKKEKPFLGSAIGFNVDIEQIIQNELAPITEGIESVEEWGRSYSDIINNSEKKDPSLAGFKLTLEKFEFGGTLDYPKLTVEPQVQFTGGDSGWGGSATIWLEGKYDDTKEKYVFNDVGLECIRVDVQQPTYAFGGSLCYVNDDVQGIKRFDANGINVKLPIGVHIGMDLTIGTKFKANKTKDYSFWRFKTLTYSAIGYPLGTSGLALHGGYGGFSSNMRLEISGLSSNTSSTQNQTRRQELFSLLESSNDNRVRYVPSLGDEKFELGLLLATTPNKELFSLDGGLYIKNEGGQKSFGLEGSAYTMSPIDGSSDKSSIWATYDINVIIDDFREGKFTIDGDISAYLKIPPSRPTILYGNKGGYKAATAKLLIQPHTSSYYLHIGNPSIPEYAEIKFDLDFYEEEVKSYFMMGTGLPTTLYIPKELKDIIEGRSLEEAPDADTVESTNSIHGNIQGQRPPNDGTGLAFGLHIIKSVDVGSPIDKFVDVNANFIAGFDLNITQSYARTCNGINPGIKGWYALGQVYVGFEGELLVFGQELAYARLVALAQGGFPKPTWVEGNLEIEYKIKAGRIASVTFGAVRCVGSVIGDGAECLASGVRDGACAIGSLLGAECGESNLDCDMDRTQENCSSEKFEQAWNDGYISGDFELNLSLGNKCLPTPNASDVRGQLGDFTFIKNVTPANNEQNVDPFLEKVIFQFSQPINRNISVPYYSPNGDISNRTIRASLEEFSITGHGLDKTWKSYGVVFGSTSNSVFINLYDGELRPNLVYRIKAKLKVTILSTNQSYYESRTITFRTGELPDQIPEKPWRSYPGEYQLYVHKDDVQRGYLEYPAWVIRDFLREGRFEDTTPDAATGSITDALTSNIKVRFEDLINPSNTTEQTLPTNAIRLENEWRGRVYFTMPEELQNNSYYKFTLFAGDKDENRDIELYSFRFKTSEFGTLNEKIRNIEINRTTNVLKLPEPFDQYDKDAFKIKVLSEIEETQSAIQNYINSLDPIFESGQSYDPIIYEIRPSQNNYSKEKQEESVFVKLENWNRSKIKIAIGQGTNFAGGIQNVFEGEADNKFSLWIWSQIGIVGLINTDVQIDKFNNSTEAYFMQLLSVAGIAIDTETQTASIDNVSKNLGLNKGQYKLGKDLSAGAGLSDPKYNLPVSDKLNNQFSANSISLPDHFMERTFFDTNKLWDEFNSFINTSEYLTYYDTRNPKQKFAGQIYKQLFSRAYPGLYNNVRNAIQDLNLKIPSEISISVENKFTNETTVVQL